jgi:hypothetical protein
LVLEDRSASGGDDVTYTRSVLRLFLLAVPFVLVAAVSALLNQIDAGPDAGFVALCLISVLSGIGVGLYVARHDGSRGQEPAATAARRAARAGR